MGYDLEKNSKRVLAVGVLFAAVGIVALVIALTQPAMKDGLERSAEDIFDPEYTVKQKAEILATLSASSTGADVPEEEKLRILESLQAQ